MTRRIYKQHSESLTIVGDSPLVEYAVTSVSKPAIVNPVKITSAIETVDYAKMYFDGRIGHRIIDVHEIMIAIMFNRNNRIIGVYKLSSGGISGTVCDPKLLAFAAVNLLASGVILVHNHPSGSVLPSDADNRLTKKIKEGLKLLEIELLDHIILTDKLFYSYANEGTL